MPNNPAGSAQSHWHTQWDVAMSLGPKKHRCWCANPSHSKWADYRPSHPRKDRSVDIKWPNKWLIRVTEEVDKGTEKNVWRNNTWNFSKFEENYKPTDWKLWANLKPKKTTPGHTLNKLLKNGDHEKNIKISQRNEDAICPFTSLVMEREPGHYGLVSDWKVTEWR